jgi:thymidylate synthase (FAD)
MHHVIPVWEDITLARDFNNLVPMCVRCHKELHAQNQELVWASSYLQSGSVDINLIESKPKSKKRSLMVDFKKINSITYAGNKQCFDIGVYGEHDNFVANNIVVHNSGRYRVLNEEFYIPKVYRKQSTDNKQASEGELDAYEQEQADSYYQNAINFAYTQYQNLINAGVCKEQARGVIPVSFYTEFYWSASLQAVANFITLRDHSHAQQEIRQYAIAMKELAMTVCPEGLSALLENMR